VGPDPFLPVVGWRVPNSERPLILLVNPAARRAGLTGKWFVRAYHRRWGVEDATRGIKQQCQGVQRELRGEDGGPQATRC
jgi:hypothetical protein